MDTIHKRLAFARETAGLTQEEVAAFFRIKRPSVAQWEGHRSKPSIEKLSALAQLYGTTQEWLTDGIGDPPSKADRSREPEFRSGPIIAPPPIIVPLIAWVSAGALQADHFDDVLANLPVSGFPPGDYFALRVEGMSMSKISPPGSIIIVDRSDKRLVPNGCYIIADPEGNATYKRWRPNPPRFEPAAFEGDHETFFYENEPLIVGRVRRSIIDM